MIRNLILLVILLSLTVAWRFTPLSEWVDIDNLTAFGSVLKDSSLAPIGVVVSYIVAGLLMVPVTVLIGATGIIFSWYLATVYAFVGCLASAITAYGIGTILQRNQIRRLMGKRFNRISRHLANRGILTIAIARNVPFAPFTIVNILAGTSHIKLSDFVLGTAIGMLPGILAITLFVNRLLTVIKNPNFLNIALVIGLAALLGLGIWWANRRLSYRKNIPGWEGHTGEP